MSLRALLLAFLLLPEFVSTAHAAAFFFTGWGCIGNPPLAVTEGALRDLDWYTFRYPCIRKVWVPKLRRREPVAGTCEGTFNDTIRSVWIEDGTGVVLFQHKDFLGRREYVPYGRGCFTLERLSRQASSLIVENW